MELGVELVRLEDQLPDPVVAHVRRLARLSISIDFLKNICCRELRQKTSKLEM